MIKLIRTCVCLSSLFTTVFVAAAEVTDFTRNSHEKDLRELLFDDAIDHEEAHRGFIAPLLNGGLIKDSNGQVVWDLSLFNFLNESSTPETVNPSLWRQARLLLESGLFQVCDRVYQVRGADIANMTIIEGDEGIILIDPLMCVETASAALELYYMNRPRVPVKAVIYSHSHVDHFGGAKGVITQESVDKGEVQVIAPEGFAEAALDENVLVGNVMSRRAAYMFGDLLPHGSEGQVTAGLGLGLSSGTITLILPNDLICKTGEKRVVDGVEIVFLFAPGSEAPAEMLFYFPQFKALGVAEDASHTMHNLYTLRGAKCRDAKAWAKYLNQVIDLFGEGSEVAFGQHHWPVWGNQRIIDFLEKQRDMYKYLHDQTLRLANKGYNPIEIAEMVQLPDVLAKEWYNRGYYGSVNHNIKGIYNFYLGWFDGNPSLLHQLPPVEASRKYIEYMGGAEVVLNKATEDFNKGNYRWVSEVLYRLVFADPENQAAKNLLALTMEQLAWQSENAVWRNFYLSGAMELRHGVRRTPHGTSSSADMVEAMPTDTFLDYLAIRLDGPRAAQSPLVLNFNLPDVEEQYVLEIKNGVLNHYSGKNIEHADATFTLNRADFNRVAMKQCTLEDLVRSRHMVIEGDLAAFKKFISLIDSFDFWFNIVEPR